MRNTVKAFWIPVILMLATAGGIVSSASADDHGSMVIIFKDGHRTSIPAADVERIEFENTATASMPGRNHFVGKWQVGDGNHSTFYITLERDGKARKSLGPPHGTWMLVDGEARISWDDGWHDVIRKVGATHEKRAFEPGRLFEDAPSNVTPAKNLEARPI